MHQTFHAQQGTTLTKLTALVAELRRGLAEAGLGTETVEIIDAEAQVVEEQATGPKPDGEIIVSRLETITKLLTAVSGTVVAAKTFCPPLKPRWNGRNSYSSKRRLPPAIRRWLLMAALLFSLLLTHPAHAAPNPDRGIYLPLISAGSTCAPSPARATARSTRPRRPPTGPPRSTPTSTWRSAATSRRPDTWGWWTTTAWPTRPRRNSAGCSGIAARRSSRASISRDWDWGCNCRAAPIASPPVTLATLAASAGEPVLLPDSGYSIGSGYEALVLYAAADRITLKYTRDDNVVSGYTLHIEGLCVAPDLLALYQALDAAGRVQLPALRAGAALGRATGPVGVAIRDNGAFLDPRSRRTGGAATKFRGCNDTSPL